MKTYRVSGFVEEVGAVQADLESNSIEEVKEKAIEEVEFYKIIGIEELE